MSLPPKVYLNKGATTGEKKKTGKMQIILEAKLAMSKRSFISERTEKERNRAVHMTLLLNRNLQETNH